MDFYIPPISDLARIDFEPSREREDVVGLMHKIIFGNAPIQTAPGAYAAKPGRMDAEFLKATTTDEAIKFGVAALVEAELLAKAQSPSTLEIPEKPATRAGEGVTPSGMSDWNWETEIGTAGLLPKKKTEPESIRYAAEPSDLHKRAASGSLTEDDYTSLLLGDFSEQQIARSAIVKWDKISRGTEVWKRGFDKSGTLVAEYLEEI